MPTCEVLHGRPRRCTLELGVAQQHAELRDGCGEPECRTWLSGAVQHDRARALTRLGVWQLLPHFDRHQFVRARGRRGACCVLILQRVDLNAVWYWLPGGDELIKGGHCVAGPHVACVLAVVVEVLSIQQAVLVPDEAIGTDP